MAESSAAVLERVTHGPVNEATGPINVADPELNPVAVMVRELFVRAREARRPLLDQWRRNYKALNNRDYRLGNTPWDEEPAVSFIWPGIASATSWMTDQRPTFEITPVAEAYSETWDFYSRLAADMNTVLMGCFTNYMLDAEITKMLWDAYTYGVGYTKTGWEAPLADGLGDAAFRRVDPFTIYPDPYSHSFADCTYIIEAKRMTIDDADRAWPGAAKLIGEASFTEGTDEAPHILDSTVNRGGSRPLLPGQLGPITGSGIPANLPGNTARSDRAHRRVESPVIDVLECYVRGYSTKPDPDNEDVTLVHDEWRCIVVSGNVVIQDRPCGGNDGVNAFGTHPYDRFVIFDSGEWYGPCIVEKLAPLQRQMNWILGSIAHNIHLMGNPQIVESPRSSSRHKRMTNRPGQRFEAEPGMVEWLMPPQVHPQMAVDLVAFYKGEIESILGLSAMVQGFAPSGRNSQGVLDSVQDAAFVRVRASLRELEITLRGVASKMAATVAEFYDEPRLMSIIGDDGQKTYLALQARHFYALDAEDWGKRIPLRFSLRADAGSQLPTSKQARAAEAKHLYELQAIDELELLKAIGWPNYAVVAQRIMEAKSAMALQNAMAAK